MPVWTRCWLRDSVVAARFISWTGKAADNTVGDVISFHCSIDITFITPEGESKPVKARIGDTLLETAEAYKLPLCGAFLVACVVIFVGDCHGNGLPRAVKRTEGWTEETFGEGIGLRS